MRANAATESNLRSVFAEWLRRPEQEADWVHQELNPETLLHWGRKEMDSGVDDSPLGKPLAGRSQPREASDGAMEAETGNYSSGHRVAPQ